MKDIFHYEICHTYFDEIDLKYVFQTPTKYPVNAPQTLEWS